VFILANLLAAFAQVLEIALTIFYWLIIVRALISWVNPDPFNPIVRMLHSVTEPVLYPLRRLFPFFMNFGVDVSAILAIFAIIFLKSFLVRTLLDISLRLR
jgi:YggT family protein